MTYRGAKKETREQQAVDKAIEVFERLSSAGLTEERAFFDALAIVGLTDRECGEFERAVRAE
tara:strand:+ start:615 stop:800 length:186 start_codon:yes stop_codon:yes gene_type:complete